MTSSISFIIDNAIAIIGTSGIKFNTINIINTNPINSLRLIDIHITTNISNINNDCMHHHQRDQQHYHQLKQRKYTSINNPTSASLPLTSVSPPKAATSPQPISATIPITSITTGIIINTNKIGIPTIRIIIPKIIIINTICTSGIFSTYSGSNTSTTSII
ncbi:hypothetical protein DPMN_047611 [Dreissena polymorpha]|uniref:Uncharacterized protein n=1 Tax=Dreissena polymorpha TaxID=45954 RepID=A0A9D4DA09_DREPO|nr:hypothetical protein DPMN_047611 [Dreissena polymorpha]